ncbi:hypothetical protein EV196_102420 [Mariniflexile fucanivorans]|uniref:DUF2938 family protein n=1 Tax=Mariniflexile fucanivorans TaxID=264023 RepID=A0A4V6NGY2_9FLAO|nr:hypothetical protein [Mariniflexile fucanivorans]TCL67857.1 hypothetical protein EV196_102420 [Mariniflexile fucanivorans]
MSLFDLSIYILVWIISVSIMTLFSIIASHLFNKEYREPIILSKIISTNNIKEKETGIDLFAGWIIHYFIGAIFIVFYFVLWHNFEQLKSVFWNIIVGLLFGIIGVVGWNLIFKIFPKLHDFDFKGFCIQLLPAHVFLCLFAMLLLNWLML